MTRPAFVLCLALLSAPTTVALAHEGHAHGEGLQFWHLLLAFVILSAAWFAWVGWMKWRSRGEADGLDETSGERPG